MVARDWRKLADFYINVFDCKPVQPERDLKGKWLEDALNLPDAHITGIHLQLPGYTDGPTLELFQYEPEADREKPYPNTPGYGHLAFSVSAVEKTAQKIIEYGGDWVGELTRVEIKGVGMLVFAYMRDPEGNILEIQRYEK